MNYSQMLIVVIRFSIIKNQQSVHLSVYFSRSLQKIPNFERCKFFWTKKGGWKLTLKNLNGLNQQAAKENITCIFAHSLSNSSCECTVVLARQQRYQYKEKQLVILREVVTRFLKTSFWFTAAAAGTAKWKKHKSAYCHFCLHGLLCCDRL